MLTWFQKIKFFFFSDQEIEDLKRELESVKMENKDLKVCMNSACVVHYKSITHVFH